MMGGGGGGGDASHAMFDGSRKSMLNKVKG